MSVLNMYDEEHIKYWDELISDFAYAWFESLAKAINQEMNKGVDAQEYKESLVSDAKRCRA